MPTEVVNLRVYNSPAYIYIGRPGIFGNPFAIPKHGNRAEVIEKFREYMDKRLQSDPEYAAAIRGLRGKTLACHCKPAACHGDVIAEYVDALDE